MLFTLQRGRAFDTLKREQRTFLSQASEASPASFRVFGVFRGSTSEDGDFLTTEHTEYTERVPKPQKKSQAKAQRREESEILRPLRLCERCVSPMAFLSLSLVSAARSI